MPKHKPRDTNMTNVPKQTKKRIKKQKQKELEQSIENSILNKEIDDRSVLVKIPHKKELKIETLSLEKSEAIIDYTLGQLTRNLMRQRSLEEFMSNF